MVDRDLVEEERAAQRRTGAVPYRARPAGLDAGTKRLALVAGGLGAVLVAVVGGWSLLGHHPTGIPVIEPLPGPVRVKPVDPGGMQLMGATGARADAPAAQALAPGPEEAAPQALQRQVETARGAVAPAEVTPAAPVPAPAPAAPAGPPPLVAPAAAPAVPPPADKVVALPPAAAGPHAVQLAALGSKAAAQAEWARLAGRAPDLLGHRVPTITETDRASRQFFRLRTGGFASIAEATAFCGRLKARGITCTLAEF